MTAGRKIFNPPKKQAYKCETKLIMEGQSFRYDNFKSDAVITSIIYDSTDVRVSENNPILILTFNDKNKASAFIEEIKKIKNNEELSEHLINIAPNKTQVRLHIG